ncbi:NAD(P)-dependent dehydrogenase (short-subunit alcohol dehydrogenase family) [Actinomycetospora succinea]|uniref:NAD(P)-dependent dehydrogenase (Short-subunit alcohol dehydrogenase family) n=1 Tax=Actinomycetospora succinea TaxID=663603 RepID=A0A4R6V2F8_9PSEU|nr:SDR family NAD(P)-dependent oxidoreductase [Actinomycetospora succinea]TDQ54112.1 NAD(P)-dependent dehydrogenase (short-subunit alcohol dehydrogenase family) [Actinomycetospora succinea]
MSERIVLVTGAGRGLGVEIARQLVSGGATVVVAARDPAAAAATAKELGERAWALTLDVTEPQSVQAAVEAVDGRHGRLDALVNNAAVNFDSGADPVTEDLEVADGAWRTNVLAPWRLSQAFAPLLRAGREPVIVNVTSGLGSLSRMGAHSPAYSVSKAGVNALTRVFADALDRDGIAVHAVSPGWTATDMGGANGRPVADGAAGIVDVVRSPRAFPSGSYLQDGEHVPW